MHLLSLVQTFHTDTCPAHTVQNRVFQLRDGQIWMPSVLSFWNLHPDAKASLEDVNKFYRVFLNSKASLQSQAAALPGESRDTDEDICMLWSTMLPPLPLPLREHRHKDVSSSWFVQNCFTEEFWLLLPSVGWAKLAARHNYVLLSSQLIELQKRQASGHTRLPRAEMSAWLGQQHYQTTGTLGRQDCLLYKVRLPLHTEMK